MITTVTNRSIDLNKNKRLRLAVFCFGVLLVFLTGGILQAQDVARGYASKDKDLKPGMVAVLSGSGTSDKPEVERADPSSAAKVIGVTISANDSLVTVGSASDQVYVQSKGEVEVYATDVNGEIKKGDGVTVSPLRGSVMKITGSEPQIGLALEDFPLESEESPLQGSETKSVRTAKIKITLASGLSDRGPPSEESALKRLGRSITGRDVGELQVVIALIIFLTVMVAEGSIIYGAVSSAITALGRNPLAKKVIVKELIRVLVMAVIVMAVGLVAIYVVLRV